jgi:phosphopantothenoylcysteine decarboxylase / phosphopantothenate---cysteine ligase
VRRILLIIGAGIAAYKVLELIRRGRERGLSFRCILTAGGQEFVTPLSLATLSGEKVFTELFSLTDEAEIGHIRLSREADLVVVAPATADRLAKMANGLADDLASTVLLATDKPVLVAPAMNPFMWAHAATRRNVDRLQADGVRFVGPNSGDMACGEEGAGRLAEPAEILAAIFDLLEPAARPLVGLRAVVTSGPTHEPLDPVRFIGNRSSGRQGHAIASAMADAGAAVTLVTGPVALPDPRGTVTQHVTTAREMLAAVEACLPADIAVFAAAVADWRPAVEATRKLKKSDRNSAPTIELVENPDVLRLIARRQGDRPRLVIGFAAETGDLESNAAAKLDRKGCDWILANDVSPETGVFGGARNRVLLLGRDGTREAWPLLDKEELARRLVARIAAQLTAPKAALA